MKRNISAVFLFALLCIMLTGCGAFNSIANDSSFTYSMNFYQEEFEEEYSHYEKELQVSEDSTEIFITGQTSSGKIDIEIICIDDDEEKTYAFEINGVTDDNILLSNGHSNDWTVLIDCYADTEGSFTISVK